MSLKCFVRTQTYYVLKFCNSEQPTSSWRSNAERSDADQCFRCTFHNISNEWDKELHTLLPPEYWFATMYVYNCFCLDITFNVTTISYLTKKPSIWKMLQNILKLYFVYKIRWFVLLFACNLNPKVMLTIASSGKEG